MRCLKLTLAYDGTAYAGWQAQEHLRTLQDTFEAAWKRITGESLRCKASGRTDSGVHALGQVVGLETESTLPAEVLCRALNAELPFDMAVLTVEDVPDGFNAIRGTRRKRYRYVIHDGPVRNVFCRAYVWKLPQRLDEAAMHRAAQALVGKHDFASFQGGGDHRKTTVRTVYELSVRRGEGPESDLVLTEIEASGYLYNMVRVIVGTLFEVGRNKRPESWPGEVLAAINRRQAGQTAPPQGLILLRAEYSTDVPTEEEEDE